MKINLGSSDDLKPGWLNVDRGPDPRQTLNYGIELDYLQADLNEPWPWADSSVEAIYAHDVFEHLTGPGGVAPKIWAMNEAWRVLQPGGRFRFATDWAAQRPVKSPAPWPLTR